MGNSGFLSNCDGYLGEYLKLQRESSLLLSCEGELRIALESLQGTQALSLVEVELSVLLTCGRKLGFPLEL